jgi:radical SAM protein with 4Fe4S-binding SPASM domain
MVSVGIGLTNDCNLRCEHCYRPQGRIQNLSLADVQKVCENLPVDSIGFGTGENGLNPDYFTILDYLNEHRIRMTLASNGLTLSMTPDEQLQYFSDVEFSVDFPDRQRQDEFRGDGNWQTVMDSIRRCRKLGLRVSILAVLMNVNYLDLGRLARLAASMDADLRVNVYQPMHTTRFMLTFDQYWEAFEILFEQSEVISVTEPLVNAMMGFDGLQGTPCGNGSIRVTPDRRLKPCVYWPDSQLTIDDLAEQKERIFESPLFRQTHFVPQFCRQCTHVAVCGGGCAARRRLRGHLELPDEYCPIYRGRDVRLNGRSSAAQKPLRSGSICTTIVRGTRAQ